MAGVLALFGSESETEPEAGQGSQKDVHNTDGGDEAERVLEEKESAGGRHRRLLADYEGPAVRAFFLSFQSEKKMAEDSKLDWTAARSKPNG